MLAWVVAKVDRLFRPPSRPLDALIETLRLPRQDGRVAVVTGGGRGIGRQVARGLALLGARVLVLDKRAWTPLDVEVDFEQVDLAVEDDVNAAVARFEASVGPVDVLVNNAVEFQVRSLRELSLEDWDYTQATNLRAPVALCQQVVPGMVRRGHGVVLNMVAPSGIAFAADMSASKAALRSLTVSLAAEVEGTGVYVLGFLPALVATDLVREVFPDYAQRLGLTFEEYVARTRPNPGYEGLQPVEHCGAAVLHALAQPEAHHGRIADAFRPLVRAGIIPPGDTLAPGSSDNVDRLREEVRAVHSRNLELDREVRRQDQALRQMAAVVQGSNVAVVTLGPERLITTWNTAAEDLFGYTEAEVVGQSPRVLVPAPELAQLQRVLASLDADAEVEPLEGVRVHKDGTEIPVRMEVRRLSGSDGEFLGAVVTATDLRAQRAAAEERDRVQRTVQQNAKLAAMGELAGGIAHDFNNMLLVFLTAAGSALEQLGPEHASSQELQDALGAARRMRSLARQLLTFSRKEPVKARVLDVDEVVGDVDRLLRRSLGDPIRVELDLGGPGTFVRIDRGQLEQVLLNLAVNARDAMPQGGTLRISTYKTTDDRVCLRVRDDGVGMRQDVVDKVFEPFFTTKPAGQGTGMGLAMVYGVVHGVGGDCAVRSAPGVGTTVTLTFPAAEGEETRVRRLSRRPMTRVEVLLVEDEPLVRRVTRRILKRAGMVVHEAESAEAALPLLDTHGQSLSLLLTDIVMPGWSGPELAREVLRRFPDLPVLYISGYADDPALLSSYDAEGEVLAKPFEPEVLVSRIRMLLGLEGSASA